MPCGPSQAAFSSRLARSFADAAFADSASAATLVRAVEAEREVEVEGGAFELRDLAAGPTTLRLLRAILAHG